MFDLDQEVAKAHQSVTETESQARAIEARIRKIDGAGPLLPARGYGRPVDTAAIANGLTLRSLIAKKDPELASYLGVGSDLAIREEEEREARRLRVQALGMETEKLRQQNEEARRNREVRVVHRRLPAGRRAAGGARPATDQEIGLRDH